MHKWRSAARTAAWYDQGDDSPNYNPFRKLNARRPILYRLEDDSGDGLQRITSEPDLTIPRADSFILPIHAGTLPERTHLTEYISAPSNVRTQSHIFRPTLEDSTAPLKVESADPQVTNIEGADVSPGGDEPEVQQLDFAITSARYRRRNIFEKVFRRNHGLLKKEHTHIGKKEHTHIGRKIGEIGKTIAAHGYPAADKTTVQTVQRNALVIDFEKDVDRAKGGNFYVTVTNKAYGTVYRLECDEDERYWRPPAIPVLASQNPFQRACSAPSSVYSEYGDSYLIVKLTTSRNHLIMRCTYGSCSSLPLA